MHFALLATALVIGGLLAIQASANLQLNAAVGTPYGASTVQLGLATGLLLVIAVAVGALGALGSLDGVEKWHLLGGLASPLYITSGILLFPRLGALVAVGLFVTGQMFASLFLDLFGLLGVAEKDLTFGIAGGAILVLIGIVMVVEGQRRAIKASGSGSAGGASVHQAGWIALGLVAGAVLPIQGAINARLRADLREPLAVGVVSFTVATITILVVLLVLLALRRTARPQVATLGKVPWWGWLGGACAAAYVTATFLLIPEIGAAATIALTVTGQQLASALIDQFGLFRLPKRTLTAARGIGIALLITGSIAVQLA